MAAHRAAEDTGIDRKELKYIKRIAVAKTLTFDPAGRQATHQPALSQQEYGGNWNG